MVDDYSYFGIKTSKFFKIFSYYVRQQKEDSCPLACTALILNIIYSEHYKIQESTFVTEDELIKKFSETSWIKSIVNHEGITLIQLQEFLETISKQNNFAFRTSIVHVKNLGPSAKNSFQHTLKQFTKDNRLIIFNFDQNFFLNLDEGIGHFSILGAYDSSKRRVLIMDIDQQTEPYWCDENILLKAMNTFDKASNQYRGYLVINY